MTSSKSNMFSSLLRCGISINKSRTGPILLGVFLYIHTFVFFLQASRSHSLILQGQIYSALFLQHWIHALIKLKVALSCDSFGKSTVSKKVFFFSYEFLIFPLISIKFNQIHNVPNQHCCLSMLHKTHPYSISYTFLSLHQDPWNFFW